MTYYNREQRCERTNKYTLNQRYMKTHQCIPALAVALAVFGSVTVRAVADEVAATTRTTTTESAGTLSDFGPDTFVVRTESSAPAVTYHYSKTTTYVDDAGNPVSVETVKSGLPVTVHYVKEGDRVIANRVIVHKRKVTTEEPATGTIEEHKTTTTTTTDRDRDHDHDRK
jgi:hypothetical protein